MKFLEKRQDYRQIAWQTIEPDKNQTWLTEGLQGDFEKLLPIN